MSKRTKTLGGMKSTTNLFLLVFLLINLVFSGSPVPVRAEGSKEMLASGLGKRPLTEWRTNTTAGLYRRTFFRVYAKAGEHILMGSSGMGLNLGDIVLYTEGQVSSSQIAPAALSAITPTFVCSTDGGGLGVLRGVDSATTRSMELQGATRNGGADGGYIPCVYTVPAGGTGTYWVAMYGPLGPTGAVDGQAGTIAAPVIDATQQAGVSVWDITVRSGSATAGADKPGRVFVDYLAQITGGNGPTRQVFSTLYAATNDGYVYRVDLNGLDPNGFILYGNRVGFLDPDGKTPLYHDVVTNNNQLTAPQGGVTLPPASAMIFFNNPLTSDLPASILPSPVPPALTNVSYLGSAGGITGYQPIGGQFTYTGNVGGISEIVISRDGVDFLPDNPLNRVIRSQAVVGTNVVDWDGKDNTGAFFPVGNGYKYRVTFHAGEYHFPLLDAENSPNGGPSLTLLNPIGGVCPFNPNCHTGFYDDRGYMVTTGTVIGTVGATLPGDANGINPPTINHSDPVNGFDTSTSQRAWGDSAASSSAGFGNWKGLDLWSYIPVGPVEVTLNVIDSVVADLRIVKSHTGQFNIGPGGGTFTINVSNVGTGAVAGPITVTDTLPAGLTPVSAATPVGSGWDPCSIAGQLVTCVHPNGAGLAVGASLQPITLTVDVALSAAPSVINTASLSNANDTNPTNNTYSDPVTINSADIGVAKSVLPIEAMEGDTVVFTITATNNGPSDATGIVLDDLLPAGLTYVSSTTTQGTYNSTTGVWTIGSLPNTASATMTITATIDAGTAGTTLTNTASRSASSPPDSDPTNDSASAVLRVLNPSMTVVKSSATISLSAPGTVTYSYLVSNTGDVALTGVILTDDNDNNDMSCPSTTLAPAATMTCTATHTFTQAELNANGSPTAASGNLVNNVTASSNEAPNATDTLSIPIAQGAAMTVVKSSTTTSLSAPGTVTYSYLVTNTGNVTLTGISLTDDNDNNDMICPSATLAPAATMTCTATHTFTQAELNANGSPTAASGSLVNNVTASSNEAPNATDTLSIPIAQGAAMTVVKSSTTTSLSAPGTVTYSYLVTNTGNVTLTGISLTDDNDNNDMSCPATTLAPAAMMTCTATHTFTQAELNANGSPTAASGSLVNNVTASSNEAPNATDNLSIPIAQSPSMTVEKSSTTTSLSAPGTVTYSYLVTNTGNVTLTGISLTDDNDNNDMSCPAATLAPAATMTCTATHTFTQAELIANGSPTAGSGSLTNNVTASSKEAPNAADNLVIPIVAADLALTKSVNNSSPVLGETVTFTITITNQSLATTATNIIVDDVLPAGLTFISAAPSVGTYNSGSGDWSIASLAPSTSATLLLNARVDQVGLLTNTAEIVAVDQPDVDSTPGNHDPSEDDQASASVGSLFDPPSGIKTFSEAGLPQLEFRLVWINSGNASAINTQITDNIPAGTTYVSGSIVCAPQGSSTSAVTASAPLNTAVTDSFCAYDPINNRIQWQGTIGPDNGHLTEAAAANEIIITFRVTVADTVNEVHNTSMSRTDTDGDSDFTDETVVGVSVISSNEVVWTRDIRLPRTLPDTGFAPNVITTLPQQPADKKYAATDVWLEVPRLKVNIPIVGVPLVDKQWDVTWLWQEAGWLNGTAFPGWSGNSVLTGHITLSNGKPGPFAGLDKLKWGDRIVVHAYGSVYTFEVRENRVVAPNNTSVLKHEEESWVTLLTCKTYNEKTGEYSSRVAVRAVLLKVELEKSSAVSER